MSTFDDHLMKKKKDTKCSFLGQNTTNHFLKSCSQRSNEI